MKNLTALFFISTLSLTSNYAVSTTSDNLDVERVISQWEMNFDEGNTQALMDLYTEDAVIFPPSSEILNNSASILAYLEGLRKVGVTDYTISNVDMEIREGIAYETALWEVTQIDSNGNVIKFDGNISNVLERQDDGSWKITLQSWN